MLLMPLGAVPPSVSRSAGSRPRIAGFVPRLEARLARTPPQDVDLQYLLGSELLVAPVFEPDAVERQGYLPAGGWYDFWTEAQLAGGGWLSVAAPLGSVPLFVCAGRILPLGSPEQFVGQAGTTELSLQVYPRDGEAEYVLREDGGQTRLVYRDGQLSIVPEGDVLRERTYHVRLAGQARARTHQVSGPTTIHL